MQTVSDRTLTAANSVLLMRVKGFNDNFVQIEGYAADNAFDFGQGKIGETMMGVDGQQSGGFTPYEVDFNIQLAPTSKSRDYFDQFTNNIISRQETRMVEFSVEISAIKKRYSATGFLVEIPGGTTAKKTLEAATYSFRIVVKPEEFNMALKSKHITIEHGRDKNRVFLLTEMPVAQADSWAMRALMALANSDINLGNIAPQQGMMGMMGATLSALSKLNADEAIPLLNELLTCVQIIPEGGQPRPLNLDFGDVEDFTTLWRLRKEVFALHTDFLQLAIGKTTASEKTVDET